MRIWAVIENITRRSFLGATTVGVTGLTGCLGASNAISDIDADYTMTLAGPYTMQAMQNYVPMMFETFKRNVENESNGRIQVYIIPAGKVGAGTVLAQRVQQGTIEAGQFSLANFSPFAPQVDLINLPYFAGTNQRAVNLVTSDIWESQVNALAEANGYKIGYYAVVDPRSLATGPSISDPPLTPSEVRELGLKHRIPGSELLQLMWNLAGANPVPVNWGETPQALEEGVVSSTHNALEFHPAFGFTDILNHEIFINAIEDMQVIALSLQWYQSLPEDLQRAIDRASEQTFKANLNAVPRYRKNAIETLREGGVELIQLSDSEIQEWKDAISYKLPIWDDYKRQLAGDMETFREFERATRTNNGYTVSSLQIPT